MKIFIPTLGTKLVLDKPWTFTLYWEDRNDEFYSLMCNMPRLTWNDIKYEWDGTNWRHVPPKTYIDQTITLPKGTELIVDRVYIRKGATEFDSITFKLTDPKYKKSSKQAGRFWAKLADVNTMEVTVI